MRVLAVTEGLVAALERNNEMTGQQLVVLEPVHDRGVVCSGVRERLERQRTTDLVRQRAVAFTQLVQHRVVLLRLRNHTDVRVVLRRRAHHGRTADVDRLDVGPFRERIEVADHEVERLDTETLEIGAMTLLGAVGEDPAVNLRVQRHNPVLEHLGRTGDVLDLRNGNTGVGNRLRGPARAHELVAQVVQTLRELRESTLVVDRQERAPKRASGAHASDSSSCLITSG